MLTGGAIAAGTAPLVGAGLPMREKERTITVLHTNDMHSRIEPFPDNDPKYPGLGGMEKRAALISQIRKEEESVLLLDAGDVFQGTPYFNEFGGELEFKLMSKMGYDAATMGNHDFDNGLEGFDRMLPHADFPFLCSNYDFSDTILNGKTETHKVFERNGIRIGLFGIGVELDGLVSKKLYAGTIWKDPVQVANDYANRLRSDEQCDLVICLSHLGYEYQTDKVSDRKLAEQTSNIDLIIGGHTHTFLDSAVKLRNKVGKEVLVTQAGWAGICVGRVDFIFREGGKQHADIRAVYPLRNNIENTVKS